MAQQKYVTRLEQWKRELSAELERDVTYEEIAAEAGVGYSTLMKHVNHKFSRPDYGTAARICRFFNERSKASRTPLDYFEEAPEGEVAALPAPV